MQTDIDLTIEQLEQIAEYVQKHVPDNIGHTVWHNCYGNPCEVYAYRVKPGLPCKQALSIPISDIFPKFTGDAFEIDE